MKRDLDIVRVKLTGNGKLKRNGVKRISGPEDVYKLIGQELSSYDRELFCMISMDAKGQPINLNIVSVGTLDASMVHPREIFKTALLSNAAFVAFAHNHPSGDPQPSKEDLAVTERLKEAGKLLGISVWDHVIVGENAYYSINSQTLITVPRYSELEYGSAVAEEPLNKVLHPAFHDHVYVYHEYNEHHPYRTQVLRCFATKAAGQSYFQERLSHFYMEQGLNNYTSDASFQDEKGAAFEAQDRFGNWVYFRLEEKQIEGLSLDQERHTSYSSIREKVPEIQKKTNDCRSKDNDRQDVLYEK